MAPLLSYLLSKVLTLNCHNLRSSQKCFKNPYFTIHIVSYVMRCSMNIHVIEPRRRVQHRLQTAHQ